MAHECDRAREAVDVNVLQHHAHSHPFNSMTDVERTGRVVLPAKMSMGRELFIEFIEKYKEFEFMWKVNDKDYKNKHKRLNAIKELLKILRKTDNNANVDTVTKKINTMRSSFNKEHNKVCT